MRNLGLIAAPGFTQVAHRSEIRAKERDRLDADFGEAAAAVGDLRAVGIGAPVEGSEARLLALRREQRDSAETRRRLNETVAFGQALDGLLGRDKVAFTGSANESLSGHERNYGSIDVYRSWIAAETERVETKIEQFEEAWNNEAVGLSVHEISEPMLTRLRELAPDDPNFPPIDEPPIRDRAKRRGSISLATPRRRA